MSGHSKWSTIKRKKGALDAKRSKIFSKISKEITIAVQEGGSADVEANSRLRLAIQNAKGVNMPKDNIERAINRANKDGSNLQEMTFEGYGIGGVAVFVECMTDNINRTVGSVRSIFKKGGGTLGTNGSLSFIFDRWGVFSLPIEEGSDREALELQLISLGAEDIEGEHDYMVMTVAMEDFGAVSKELEQAGFVVEEAGLKRVPNSLKALELEQAKQFLKMIDEFEENDDVQAVYHNLEITEDLEDKLYGEEV